jgi:hypothetical protein
MSEPWESDFRRGWVSNSLKYAAKKLREQERDARLRFAKPSETGDVWRDPALWIADAYAEAATVFEKRLAAMPDPQP